MSFIRPELARLTARWFSHWSEPLVIVVIAAIGVSLLHSGWRIGATVPMLLGGAICAVALLMLVTVIRRARLHRETSAPGLVEVTERRVTYLSPDGAGGIVELDALTRLEIVTTDQGPGAPDAFWVLWHRDGPPVSIPAASAGADALIDAFIGLPGLNMDRIVTAMGSATNQRFEVWSGRQTLH